MIKKIVLLFIVLLNILTGLTKPKIETYSDPLEIQSGLHFVKLYLLVYNNLKTYKDYLI